MSSAWLILWRRQCEGCGRRFTTHERLAPVDVRVEKAGGQGEVKRKRGRGEGEEQIGLF